MLAGNNAGLDTEFLEYPAGDGLGVINAKKHELNQRNPMEKKKSLHPRPASASAFVWRCRSRSIQLSLATVLASVLTASADSLDNSNLAALNQFTLLEYKETAVQYYAGLQSIFDTPISQITAFTPAGLRDSLNNGLASGAGINFGPGVNALAGAHQISQGDAGNLQSIYHSDNNKAELVAYIYGSMGVNLAQVFRSIFLLQTTSTIGPSSPSLATTFNILHDRVFDQIKTADEEQSASAQNGDKNKFLGLQPTIEASAFFEQANLKGGMDLELYGVNLSVEESSDRFKCWLTVPLQWTTYASSTFMTYGVDVGAKYELIRDTGLFLGVHGNYLANDGDGSFEDNNMAGGPFLGYTYKINDKFYISTGLLADYVHPQSEEDTWVGAVGVNLGVRLSNHIALNTYYSYWRDLGNDNVFLGTDWHEVGVDLTYTLGRSWRLVLGAKTALGYEGYDSDYQIHAGVGSQF